MSDTHDLVGHGPYCVLCGACGKCVPIYPWHTCPDSEDGRHLWNRASVSLPETTEREET